MTRMTWAVSFEVQPGFQLLWSPVTQSLISDGSANLQAAMEEDVLHVTVERRLPGLTCEEFLQAFLDFVWGGGGGLPTPQPDIIQQSFDPLGTGLTRRIAPVGLIERITRVELSQGPNESVRIHYMVDNPGFRSFYPVVQHSGCVEFAPKGGASAAADFTWSVTCRPLPGCRSFVGSFTELIVTMLTQNLRRHLKGLAAA
eukprot:TRINITY_DN28373_c0_g1_i1.p1 TRINITY_DN28373_c0_g1~~TRINITY_DN28373_c0_g1_i1.p1  ORF type:complete len:200 (-),score=22.35 TRINITY_DN28373_c0_g1_i1:121-720(-)